MSQNALQRLGIQKIYVLKYDEKLFSAWEKIENYSQQNKNSSQIALYQNVFHNAWILQI